MELTTQEAAWIEGQRTLGRRVFVGIDHHAAQLTVAAATGEILLKRPDPATLSVQRFSQDVYGYRELLAYLDKRFPGTDRGDIYFLSEPTFARPLGHFLAQQGFAAEQVLWAKTEKVPQFRKAHDLSRVGKNDDADSRTLLMMLFTAHRDPGSRIQLRAAAAIDPTHDALRQLAAEYYRLSNHSIQLQNKIYQLVMLLFPELRRLFRSTQRRRKPDGTTYEVDCLELFSRETPLAVLGLFPDPRALAAAGAEAVWAAMPHRRFRKATIWQMVELARVTAGVPDVAATARLRLLIEEYQQLRQHQQRYRDQMLALVTADPVLRSFLKVACMSEVTLAALVGEVGCVDRFSSADRLKSYLGLAPRPMPQSAKVDDQGRVVQTWRMPANTYERSQGQRRLVWVAFGRHVPRRVMWFWFQLLLRNRHKCTDDPFLQLYLRLQLKHAGSPRALGRVRWKVVGKFVQVLFTCLKNRQPYEPQRLKDGLAGVRVR